jgi:hypothetical protein
MTSLPGLRRLAEALDESRAVERELDEQEQVKDAGEVDRLADLLEIAPSGFARP